MGILYADSSCPEMDMEYRINGCGIRCISPEKMAQLFPDGKYPLAGETLFDNRKEATDRISLCETSFLVSAVHSHNSLFYKKIAYIKLIDGKYLILLKKRELLLRIVPAAIAAAAVAVAVIAVTSSGKQVEKEVGIIAPDYQTATEDEHIERAVTSNTRSIMRVILPSGTVDLANNFVDRADEDADLQVFITVNGEEQELLHKPVNIKNGSMQSTTLDFPSLTFEVLPGNYPGRALLSYADGGTEEIDLTIAVVTSTTGSVSISFSNHVTVDLETGDITLLYSQDSDATHDAIVQLIIGSEENAMVIAESGIIPGGAVLKKMTLDPSMQSRLTQGVYSGRLRLNFYNGSDVVTDVNTDIEVTVTVK